MSYKVKAIPKFEKNLKKLAKKYASVKGEYAALVKSLKEDPQQGTPIGHDCYKIRLSIASKGKGKSGRARVTTHFYVDQDTVFLLSIYDKSEKENISEKQIKALLKLLH